MYSVLTSLLFSSCYHTYTALYCRQAYNCSTQHPINGRKSFSWNCYDSNCVQAGFEVIFFGLRSTGINTVLALSNVQCNMVIQCLFMGHQKTNTIVCTCLYSVAKVPGVYLLEISDIGVSMSKPHIDDTNVCEIYGMTIMFVMCVN